MSDHSPSTQKSNTHNQYQRSSVRHNGRSRGPVIAKDAKIDYKDLRLLRRCVTENGKIMPARLTNFSRAQQRDLKKAVERARFLSLIHYVV